MFAITLLLLICIAVVVYMTTRDTINNEEEISESYKEIQRMDKLYFLLIEAESSRREYFTTEDKEYTKIFQHTAATIDTLLKELKTSTKVNQIQRYYIDTLELFTKQRIDFLRRGFELEGKKGTALILHELLMGKGQEVHNKIEILITSIEDEEKEKIQQKSEIARKSARYSLIVLFGGIFICIVVLASVYSYLDKKISKYAHDPDSHIMTREELEHVVRERTKEIAEINQRLNSQVDKQERTEQLLKELERDYRGLFEQAHDAIIIFRPEDEVVIEVNQRACEIYDIPKERFIGLSIKGITKNIPENEKNLKHTLSNGFSYNFQTVHYKRDGTEILMEINASVVTYEDRKVILSINRDITERILQIPIKES